MSYLYDIKEETIPEELLYHIISTYIKKDSIQDYGIKTFSNSLDNYDGLINLYDIFKDNTIKRINQKEGSNNKDQENTYTLNINNILNNYNELAFNEIKKTYTGLQIYLDYNRPLNDILEAQQKLENKSYILQDSSNNIILYGDIIQHYKDPHNDVVNILNLLARVSKKQKGGTAKKNYQTQSTTKRKNDLIDSLIKKNYQKSLTTKKNILIGGSDTSQVPATIQTDGNLVENLIMYYKLLLLTGNTKQTDSSSKFLKKKNNSSDYLYIYTNNRAGYSVSYTNYKNSLTYSDWDIIEDLKQVKDISQNNKNNKYNSKKLLVSFKQPTNIKKYGIKRLIIAPTPAPGQTPGLSSAQRSTGRWSWKPFTKSVTASPGPSTVDNIYSNAAIASAVAAMNAASKVASSASAVAASIAPPLAPGPSSSSPSPVTEIQSNLRKVLLIGGTMSDRDNVQKLLNELGINLDIYELDDQDTGFGDVDELQEALKSNNDITHIILIKGVRNMRGMHTFDKLVQNIGEIIKNNILTGIIDMSDTIEETQTETLSLDNYDTTNVLNENNIFIMKANNTRAGEDKRKNKWLNSGKRREKLICFLQNNDINEAQRCTNSLTTSPAPKEAEEKKEA